MDGQLFRLLSRLFERGRSFRSRAAQERPLPQAQTGPGAPALLDKLCQRLLSGKGEASGLKIAHEIATRYALLKSDEKKDFFRTLAEDYAPDWGAVRTAWQDHEQQPTRGSFQALVQTLEPPRQELFRRINRAPGGTPALLHMRSDLLATIRSHPEFGVVDDDLVHLFRSWFNRGFLVMEQIDWSTSADLLERVIRYEAVHQIGDWDELRRRLLPPDRRCYAFFHPALANDPLIFVEVALARAMPDSIQALLATDREPLAPDAATTAVFYSISNCQTGLQGISFGNFLIKQVVEELLRELPNLSTFVTLSPVPGFRKWLSRSMTTPPQGALADLLERDLLPSDEKDRAALGADLMLRAADYLLDAKDDRGRPLDPVARFHLGNGARLERICWPADVSPNGMAASAGVMVNYLYDLKRVEDNHEAFANDHAVIASEAVRKMRKMKRSLEAANVG
jgi:malonyl-CoA decarboxylase